MTQKVTKKKVQYSQMASFTKRNNTSINKESIVTIFLKEQDIAPLRQKPSTMLLCSTDNNRPIHYRPIQVCNSEPRLKKNRFGSKLSQHSHRSRNSNYNSNTSIIESENTTSQRGYSFAKAPRDSIIEKSPGPGCYLINDSCLARTVKSPRATIDCQRRVTSDSFISNDNPGVGSYVLAELKSPHGPSFRQRYSPKISLSPGPSDYKAKRLVHKAPVSFF